MSASRGSVAAVIPALNEALTIGPIVRTLVKSGVFQDVIVISDGSTDATADVARKNGATIVRQVPITRGKGAAMVYGASLTDAQTLFFCDADLIGLTVSHVKRILKTVISGQHMMVVGIRDRGSMLMKASEYLPLIGGERAVRRHVFDSVPQKFMKGYMVETALNFMCRANRFAYGAVPLPGLTIRHKIEKVGVWQGVRGYVRMSWQILSAMLRVRYARLRGEF